jgi:hypothetical protein
MKLTSVVNDMVSCALRALALAAVERTGKNWHASRPGE